MRTVTKWRLQQSIKNISMYFDIELLVFSFFCNMQIKKERNNYSQTLN